MNRLLKNLLVWIAIVGAVLLFYKFLQAPSSSPLLMDSIQFAEAVRAGRVTRVRLPQGVTVGGDLSEKGSDGQPVQFVIAAPAYRDLVDDLPLCANMSETPTSFEFSVEGGEERMNGSHA